MTATSVRLCTVYAVLCVGWGAQGTEMGRFGGLRYGSYDSAATYNRYEPRSCSGGRRTAWVRWRTDARS